MSTSRNGARASSMARCASQPPSISMPVSQRILPTSCRARSCSAPSSLRTSTRVNRSSASCSQYQSEVRPSRAGAPGAGSRRRGALRVAFCLLAEREAAMAPLFPAVNLVEGYPCVQSNKVCDGIGIVGEKRELGFAGTKQAILFFHQAAQGEHPHADGERIVEVAARDVDVRAGRLQAREQAADLGLELERR